MNYIELVDKFRELARDILRLRWINNIKDDIHYVDNTISLLEKSKEEINKDIARANYRLSKTDQTNPDYPELKVLEDDRIKRFTELLEREDKNILERIEKKNELNKMIAKVESGESKVNIENVSIKAKELAEEYGKELARQAK